MFVQKPSETTNIYQTFEEPALGVFTNIPPELIMHTLSFLNREDLPPIFLINRTWKLLATSACEQREKRKILELIDCIKCQVHEHYPEISQKLTNLCLQIAENYKNRDLSFNLIAFIKTQKFELLSMLQSLKKEDAKHIDIKDFRSHEFKDFLALLDLEISSFECLSMTNEEEKAKIQHELIQEYLKLNHAEKALNLAKIMSETIGIVCFRKRCAISEIITKSSDLNVLDEIIKSNFFPFDAHEKNNLRLEVSNKLIALKELDKALDLVDSFSELGKEKGTALVNVIKASPSLEQLDRVHRAAKKIINDEDKFCVLRPLVTAFRSLKCFQIVDQINQSIPPVKFNMEELNELLGL
ncbi:MULTISPECIES: hypothetical protein [Parachlamydia]|jgi:hypothetical protein|uniref:F-box domain-containing protein n=2 Tax=Parachlamydia acanthamoebae TaxID=83552 RepID=F8KZG8_PARAV|nr:hypothetical protein [Parachlamydia acanthamoebae]EFB41806.1 hypothetical protein pah_c022o094 [Parachlamydia acanthamoebae str. Hall's coccus]KIA77964.1 hypothetical protein DB43_FG00230 [Parachlamydia acanthamoebae]CCB86308.1 putative uncharacterized protein [Parachlamydia acanthamoebae UV-7]